MIPVCEPTLGEKEEAYALDCIRSGWISSSGKYIEAFEKEFAEFCGVTHAVSCSNGTTALHLAVESLGIGPGDEVICPDFSIIATSNAIIYAGAKPVFVDVEPITGNIDATKIEEAITENTKAIMVVHMYGRPADMAPIYQIADKHDLYIIEDAAEAHGADWQGAPVGCLGDVAAFSFYANKIITCGEGGMVVTNHSFVADNARLLRNHAFMKPRFVHEEIGYNYRMTNIQAAIGLAQLEKVDALVTARMEVEKLYREYLKDIPGIVFPPPCDYGTRVCWMFNILINEEEFGISRDELMILLGNHGIETRSYFHPLSLQLAYVKKFGGGVYHKNSAYLWKNGLYLPSSGHLTPEEVKFICNIIRGIQQ